MGKRKYLDKIEELFEKSPVVSFKSIEKIIGKKKTSNYAKLLINNLIKKKKIFRLAKGFYTKHNENSLLVFCFKPSYLGLQSALSHHELWDQGTMPILITSKNVRAGIRDVNGANVQIKKIDGKLMFGFEYIQDANFYLPYSDIEKTFIDMIYFKQDLSKETLANFKKRINLKKLKSYLGRYSKGLKKKICGILKK